MKQVREILPSDCILVGQTIDHGIFLLIMIIERTLRLIVFFIDTNWLGLRRGIDYKESVDLMKIFRVHNWMPYLLMEFRRSIIQ